jgi:hypothetical protein
MGGNGEWQIVSELDLSEKKIERAPGFIPRRAKTFSALRKRAVGTRARKEFESSTCLQRGRVRRRFSASFDGNQSVQHVGEQAQLNACCWEKKGP